MKILGGCVSERGNVRLKNEDAAFCRVFAQKDESFAVGAVCDGIGGLDSGEVASGLIIGELEKWMDAITGWVDLASADGDILFSHLKDGVEEWNRILCDYCRGQGIRSGTTLSLLMLLGGCYYIIQVGDSRIYRYRDGLQQMTRDDSVTRLKNQKVRTYLDNYMGKEYELRYQCLEGKTESGDLFLFCTDGFYHWFTEEDAAVLSAGLRNAGLRKKGLLTRVTLKEENNSMTYIEENLCRPLIREMMARGERDNISLGLLWNAESSDARK